MSTSLREFHQKKTEGTDLKERNRLRSEWLGSLNRLFDQIREWLREADPEEVLEVVSYKVERVEQRLGVYDAPGITIRLGTDSVQIVPSGRYAHKPLAFETLLGVQGNEQRWGDLSGGASTSSVRTVDICFSGASKAIKIIGIPCPISRSA